MRSRSSFLGLGELQALDLGLGADNAGALRIRMGLGGGMVLVYYSNTKKPSGTALIIIQASRFVTTVPIVFILVPLFCELIGS